MDLMIRRYEAADHDAVWDLNNHALDVVGAHPGSAMFADLHIIEQVYFSDNGEFLVGTFDGEIVAMGAFKRIDDSTAELTRMRIHPDHQRRGYGQAILSALVARAPELGYSTLHLETTVQQVAAQGLYESNGFSKVGTDRYEEFELLLYEKQLS